RARVAAVAQQVLNVGERRQSRPDVVVGDAVVDAPTRRERRGEVGALGRSDPSQLEQLAPIGHRLLPRGPGVGGPGRSQTGAIVGHERDGISLVDAASYSAA